MAVPRRLVLTSTAAALGGVSAGCLGSAPSDDAAVLTIRVSNQTARSETVTVTVTGPDGELRAEYTDREIPSGVSESFEPSGLDAGEHRLRVTGEEWETSSDYDPDRCREYVFVTTLEGTPDDPSVTSESDCRA